MKKKLLAGIIGTLVALSVGSAIAQPYAPPPGPHYEQHRMEYQRRQVFRIQDRINAQQA